MEYHTFDGPGGLKIRVPKNDDYRTCTVCGGDCVPEDATTDGLGARIVFVCPEHGLQGIIDPFAESR